jgi:hypothetical protein
MTRPYASVIVPSEIGGEIGLQECRDCWFGQLYTAIQNPNLRNEDVFIGVRDSKPQYHSSEMKESFQV